MMVSSQPQAQAENSDPPPPAQPGTAAAQTIVEDSKIQTKADGVTDTVEPSQTQESKSPLPQDSPKVRAPSGQSGCVLTTSSITESTRPWLILACEREV